MTALKGVQLILGILVLTGHGQGGRILFYIPYAAKSSCTTMVPIATELVNRGHNVTLVTEWDSLKMDKRIQHIAISSKSSDQAGKELSNHFLSGHIGSKLAFMGAWYRMVQAALHTNSEAVRVLKPLVESE